MDAGAYRERIKVENVVGKTEDKIGNKVKVWEELFNGYAYVNNISGSEYWQAAQVKEQETVMFFVRYHKVFDTLSSKKCRIKWKGKIYNVTFIDNVQNKNEVVKFRTLLEGAINE